MLCPCDCRTLSGSQMQFVVIKPLAEFRKPQHALLRNWTVPPGVGLFSLCAAPLFDDCNPHRRPAHEASYPIVTLLVYGPSLTLATYDSTRPTQLSTDQGRHEALDAQVLGAVEAQRERYVRIWADCHWTGEGMHLFLF